MIVYDKNIFGSSREIDSNGFLRVEMSNITKSQIRPYLGREIPDWRDFNLDPEKIYNVLCPEEELIKAIPTFNNLPLTRDHIAVDVDNVPKERIVGSLGDHATYEKPYIKNNLIVYDKKDIDLIMSGKKKELSCGYRYTPVREDGEFEGQHYDFKMTDIVGNHIALVKQGRAGRDVMVADSIKNIKEKVMSLFVKKQVVQDEKEEDIEWITVKGNHIPVKKGQSKEEAVSSFIESKEESSKEESNPRLDKELEGRSVENIEKIYQKKLDAYKKSVKLGDEAGARAFKKDAEYIEKYMEKQEDSDLTKDSDTATINNEELPVEAGKPEVVGDEKTTEKGETEMAEEVKEVKKEEEKKPETPAKVEEEKPAEAEKVVEDSCSKGSEPDKKDEEKKEASEEKVVEDKSEEDKKEEKKEEDKKDEKKEEMAKDSALVMDADAIRAEARQEAIEDFKGRDCARKAVRSIVGDVDIFAFDSAEDIYKFACGQAGMDLDGIANFKDAFIGLKAGKAKLAMDASPISGSNEECLKNIRLA